MKKLLELLFTIESRRGGCELAKRFRFAKNSRPEHSVPLFTLIFLIFSSYSYAEYKWIKIDGSLDRYSHVYTEISSYVCYEPLDPPTTFKSVVSTKTPEGAKAALNHYYEYQGDVYYAVDVRLDYDSNKFGIWGVQQGRIYDDAACDDIPKPSISHCPSLMKEQKVDNSIFPGLNYRCVADDNTTKEQCEANGGYWIDPIYGEVQYSLFSDPANVPYDSYLFSNFGSGCVDLNFVNSDAMSSNFSLITSGLLVSTPVKALAGFFDKVFAGGKKLYQWVLEKMGFNSNISKFEDPKVFIQEPEIIDVEVVNNEAVPQIGWNDPGNPNLIDDVPVPYPPKTPDVPTGFYDNLPNPDFVDEFKPSFINAKHILDEKTDIPTSPDIEVGGTATQTITLNDSLLRNKPIQENLVITKTKTQNFSSYVEHEYKASIPDRDLNFKIVERIYNDGAKVKQITVTTPTKPGFEFQRTYQVQTNSDGSTSSSYISESQITDGNNVISNSTGSSESNSEFNLDPLVGYLRSIDTTSKELAQSSKNIEQKLDDLINYRPPNANEFSVTLDHFNASLLDFSTLVDNLLDYINQMLDNLQNIQEQMEQAKDYFNNKPNSSLPSGSCGFSATFYHHTYVVDPCKFVAPYRPLLTLFFTLFFSFEVLLFAIKYLFSTNPGGGR
ncbi:MULTISPECIES: hypothetical protein [unclassified Nitratiruptor]|uniref:hypothetical protein n=1 Tax=unclassified Nitratiruptor TaxID=2624044 RepID=UPI00191511E3|nr:MULTISPECIES: hypothetical protein [unclassified Nitratiruptor]BCD60036.1 hypothetical protein NitYY0810_C0799 [Nitratiruptor sp. YY08-10]BCD63957.1 hypothetical protein NitYY0814_C0796 [Nitratiruptor sp. YY08-14]BCD64474.1 hypothetical protein NitYY0814_C1321 [Nitratiruptor sp. YY08-14]